jgi:F-type H+-transporting ATPase subunit delta
MASRNKQVQLQARQFFKLSLVDGQLSADRVAGILQYAEKNRAGNTVAVLKANQRLINAEVARGEAVVEHAGPIGDALLANIATAMTKKYARKVTSRAQRTDALLAGMRIRVGDDVYESSVAGQLAALAESV